MFHGQEDKRECKHTGKQSRGEGSMMEVGVGVEGESIKGDKKGGCARRAEVGRRRRMGRASEIGGATRREETKNNLPHRRVSALNEPKGGSSGADLTRTCCCAEK